MIINRLLKLLFWSLCYCQVHKVLYLEWPRFLQMFSLFQQTSILLFECVKYLMIIQPCAGFSSPPPSTPALSYEDWSQQGQRHQFLRSSNDFVCEQRIYSNLRQNYPNVREEIIFMEKLCTYINKYAYLQAIGESNAVFLIQFNFLVLRTVFF